MQSVLILMSRIVTFRMLEMLKSQCGGYTRASLNALGVSWPPPRGWLKKLKRQAKDNAAKCSLEAVVKEQSEENTLLKVHELLTRLSPVARLTAFHKFCLYCGGPDPDCVCWKDE